MMDMICFAFGWAESDVDLSDCPYYVPVIERCLYLSGNSFQH